MNLVEKSVLPLWEAWWNRQNSDPLSYIIYQAQDLSRLDQFKQPWMPEGVTSKWDHWKPELMGALALRMAIENDDSTPIDQWVDYMSAYAACYGHQGGGYSFLCPGFGPVCLASFISGIHKYVEPTVWAEPPTAMSYQEIQAAIEQPSPEILAYRRHAHYMIEQCARRLAPSYIISQPDFGDGLDVLSTLRHSMNLLTDLYDCPEEIQESLEAIGRFSQQMFDEYASVLTPANGGAMACVMRYLSAKPTYLTFCDFSAMISPDMFAEFVAPVVRRHCQRFSGRTVYHLDGPGELPHVEQLCAIDGLFAVQWVQGAGNPGALDQQWYPLYRQLLDAGKRICISVPWDSGAALRALFASFPAEEFNVNTLAPDRAEAEKFAVLVSSRVSLL